MLYPELLQHLGETFGRDFYVIPSSIHEVILIPETEEFSIEYFSDMVKGINEKQMYPTEVLSDSIYYYDKETLTFVSNLDSRPTKMVSEYGVGKFEFKLDMDGEVEPVEEEFKKVCFNIRNNESCAFNPGKSLELYDLNHSYRLVFTKEDASTQYALAIEELYKQRQK